MAGGQRGVILFAGIPSEPPLALAIEAACRRGVPHVVLNQRHSEHDDLCLGWGPGGFNGTLAIDGHDVPVASLTGIYARTVELEALPEFCAAVRAGNEAASQRMTAFSELLHDLLDIAPCRVANRPQAMGSNMSKPYQAQLITGFGLHTPETLITNDPDEVRAFHAVHGRVIYKSISSVRSIVQEWTPGGHDDLSRVSALPTQFQALVPGVDVRVHVVDTAVFATEVASEAIDYRYAGRQGLEVGMTAVTLPDPVSEACVALTKALGLVISGIDLRRMPDGLWYCFEANPSPAYSYYQDRTGQPIAEALVDVLGEAR